jgi:hypothetical protein
MNYTLMDCGCCKNEEFDEWYNKKEAFFIKKGIFIMEDLMKDSNDKYLKYCFSFDFENPNEAFFNIYNYYNQKSVCKFSFITENNSPRQVIEGGQWYSPKIKLNFYNRTLMDGLNGDFCNEITMKKVDDHWEGFDKKVKNKSQKYINNTLKEFEQTGRKMEHEFMCEHTVYFCYATMFYFSLKNPDIIDFSEYEKNEDKEVDFTFKSVTRKYSYSGYINLNQSKIYKPNNSLIQKKRGEYQRHIEKWGVRGHYRNVNGKKIWIDQHTKGTGNLEKRIYGDQKECDVNVLSKVFEVNTVKPVKIEDLSSNESNIVSEIAETTTTEPTSIEPSLVISPEPEKKHISEKVEFEKSEVKLSFLQKVKKWLLDFLKK